jgi:hypothetical protein
MITRKELYGLFHYDEDTGVFVRRKSSFGATAGRINTKPNGDGYIRIQIRGKRYKAHVLAWLYVYGKLPNGNIDHINRNPADNRISNLREATHGQNCRNATKYKNNRTGYKGVFRRRNGSYRAYITYNHVRYNLGHYKTPELASAAYKKKAMEFDGEFYNFDDRGRDE